METEYLGNAYTTQSSNDGCVAVACPIDAGFYDWMTRDPLENHECRECVYLPVCGGGCGSVSYNQSKTYHAPGCFKTKGVVEKQILHFVNEKIKTNVEVKK